MSLPPAEQRITDQLHGRRFSEDSLPPRPQREWTVADLTPPHEPSSSFDLPSEHASSAPSPAAKSRPHPPDLSIPSSGRLYDPDHANADHDGYGTAIPTPRSALDYDHDQSTGRNFPSKNASSRGRDARLPPDKPADPRSPPASPRRTVSSPSRPSVAVNGDSTDHARPSQPNGTPSQHPDNASSPSSAGEGRSANTSRADGRSTATSPEQESVGQGPPHQSEPSGDAKRSRDVFMADAPVEDAGVAPMTPASSKIAGVDGIAPTRALGLADDPDVQMRDPARKRRRVTKQERTSVVLSKPGPPDKDVDLVRTLQRYTGADDRVPSKKKDWMHLLFLRQALDQSHGHKSELLSLLGSSNKVLSTTDWQFQLREKQDCAIIKRIYEWQQVSRWPLRQLRLPTEFPTPVSHQDCMMAEMKWLKTDFREERKFKVSICAQLAQSCAQWHNADASGRAALLVKPDLAIVQLGLTVETEADEDDDGPALQHVVPSSIFKQHEFYLDEDIASQLPLYEPIKAKGPDPPLRTMISQSGLIVDEPIQEEPTEPDAQPEDESCALFQSEWEALRRRQQAPFAFKPPNTPMPHPSFYENRRASQWTEEEDRQLKAWAKDFPSNWSLIAERHNQKSQYVPAIQRRTPWECYERFVMLMEGAATDPTTRQFAKQFQNQLERIRAKWQASVQQQAQQAQNNGQQFAAPRFPVPVRVDRRSNNKRFLGLVDAARKLARKRETAESTRKQSQENAAAHAAHSMNATHVKNENQFTPEALSLLKYKRQMEASERAERVRAQQRALMAVQHRGANVNANAAQLGYNANAQRVSGGQPGMSAPQANGHLAVPGSNQQRSFAQQQQQQAQLQQQQQQQQQQQGQQFSVPAGASSSQMQQMMMSTQNQMALQAQQQQSQQSHQQQQAQHQRSYSGSQQSNDQNLQQQLMRQQARGGAQFAAQRPVNGQPQFNRAAANAASAVPNVAMMGQFGQSDSGQSVRADSNGASQQHSFPLNEQGVPQSLSSGRVPTVTLLQHQIAKQHPGISQEDLQRLTSNELQSIVESQQRVSGQTTALDRSRQNAINAATGLHGAGQHSRQSSSGQHSAQAQSAYNMHNGMLAANAQARSASPGGLAQNNQYAQQMRQATTQQMRRNGVPSSQQGQAGGAASPVVNMASPAGSMASPALQAQQLSGQIQRPGSSMQPPGAGMGMSPAVDASRPGSAQLAATPRLASQSPRPVSSQSQAAQG